MATDVQTRYDTLVEENISQVRQKIRLADLGRGMLALACLLLGYALVVAGLDLSMGARDAWWSVAVRLVAFVGMLVGVSVLGVRTFRRFAANVNPYFAARRLEESIPESKNSVINWLDLKDAALPPAIHQAVGMRAARDVKKADPDLSAAPRDKWKLALATVVFAMGLVALFAVKPHQFGPLMARAFVPLNAGTLAPTTTIEILKPTSAEAPANQRVEFLAKIEGSVPAANTAAAPSLHYRYATNDVAVRVPLEEDTNGHWSARLSPDQLRTGLYWKITAGDAATLETQLRVRAQPFVTRFEATYAYRPYRKLAPETVRMPNDWMPTPRIFGHRGTNVVLKARLNAPAKTGLLELDLHGVKKTLVGDVSTTEPQTLVFHFTLDKPGTFRVLFETPEGEKNHDRSPYILDVLEDGTPMVELVVPGKDLIAPANGTVLLAGVALDDFGVSGLTLQLALNAKSGLRPLASIPYVPKAKLQFDDGTYPPRVEYVESLLLDQLRGIDKQLVPLAAGDEITYWLEATDNFDLGPRHVGRSKSFKITIQDGLQPKMQQETQRKQVQGAKQQHDQQQADQHDQENKQHGQDKDGAGNNGPGDNQNNQSGEGGKGNEKSNSNEGKGNDSNDGNSAGKTDPKNSPSSKSQGDPSKGDGGASNANGQGSQEQQAMNDLRDKLGKVADKLNQELKDQASPKQSADKNPEGQPKDNGGQKSPENKGNDGDQQNPMNGAGNDRSSGPNPPPQPGDGNNEKGSESGAKDKANDKKTPEDKQGGGGSGESSNKDTKGEGAAASGNPAKNKSPEAGPAGNENPMPGGKDPASPKSAEKKGPIDSVEKGETSDNGTVESTDQAPKGNPTQVKDGPRGKPSDKSKANAPTKAEIDALRDALQKKSPDADAKAKDLAQRGQDLQDPNLKKQLEDTLRDAGRDDDLKKLAEGKSDGKSKDDKSNLTRKELEDVRDQLKKGGLTGDNARKKAAADARSSDEGELQKLHDEVARDPELKKLLDDILSEAGRQNVAGGGPPEAAPPPQKDGTPPKQGTGDANIRTGPGGGGVLDELKAITPEEAFARRLGDLQIDNLDALKKRVGAETLKKANISDQEWQQFLENARQYRELMAKTRQRDDAKILSGRAGKLAPQSPRDIQSNPSAQSPLDGAQASPPWEFRDLQRRFTSKSKTP